MTLTLVAALGAACLRPVELYCDEDTPCADRYPDRPFCDLHGEHPASEGIGRTCIPDPFATGECESGEFLRCLDGGTAIVCDAAGTGEEQVPCGFGCNAAAGRCNDCEPETALCEADRETRCDSAGRETVRDCALGCHEAEPRCLDVEPSNGLGVFLDDAATAPDLELPEGSVIDTDQGAILVDGEPVSIPNALLDAPPGGVPVRVFTVRSLLVTGEVTVSGTPAVAFVADDVVSIRGHLRVGHSGRGLDGNGSASNLSACLINCPCQGSERCSCPGRGGGGFGASGGRGGKAGTVEGGLGGPVVGNSELVPLRGGGSTAGSSDFNGGRGGGAVQLVSRASIAVSAGGAIDAGGERGTAGIGGGAGGGILLEAPTVLVTNPGTAVVANGAGGGCANGVTKEGESGRLDDQRAAGCEASEGGDGGHGGSAMAGATAGLDANANCSTISPWQGGGGGGGAGRIRANTANGAFSPLSGATVSPAPSLGTVRRR